MRKLLISVAAIAAMVAPAIAQPTQLVGADHYCGPYETTNCICPASRIHKSKACRASCTPGSQGHGCQCGMQCGPGAKG